MLNDQKTLEELQGMVEQLAAIMKSMGMDETNGMDQDAPGSYPRPESRQGQGEAADKAQDMAMLRKMEKRKQASDDESNLAALLKKLSRFLIFISQQYPIKYLPTEEPLINLSGIVSCSFSGLLLNSPIMPSKRCKPPLTFKTPWRKSTEAAAAKIKPQFMLVLESIAANP